MIINKIAILTVQTHPTQQVLRVSIQLWWTLCAQSWDCQVQWTKQVRTPVRNTTSRQQNTHAADPTASLGVNPHDHPGNGYHAIIINAIDTIDYLISSTAQSLQHHIYVKCKQTNIDNRSMARKINSPLITCVGQWGLCCYSRILGRRHGWLRRSVLGSRW